MTLLLTRPADLGAGNRAMPTSAIAYGQIICPVAILPIVPITAPRERQSQAVLPMTMRVGMLSRYIITGM